jgi:hypothetical protein
MKAKLLEFASIYFYQSGLFNGLRRFQIKESGLVSSSAPNVSNPLIQLFFSLLLAQRPPRQARGSIFPTAKL